MKRYLLGTALVICACAVVLLWFVESDPAPPSHCPIGTIYHPDNNCPAGRLTGHKQKTPPPPSTPLPLLPVLGEPHLLPGAVRPQDIPPCPAHPMCRDEKGDFFAVPEQPLPGTVPSTN